MKTITVFTPTYNRAYCLHRVYESLCKQNQDSFIWLVIDDGSTDNTKELVQGWTEEKKIEIQYIYQSNMGMHSTYNTAYKNITTELNVCIDSDDYMADNAIELVLDFWDEHKSEEYAGMVGLDATSNGNIIGNKLPDNLYSSTLEELYHKYKVKGDKKLVYRTEVVRKYPEYPSFDGENFVPHGSLFLQIDKDYELLCLNKVLCIVEYMEDGSSRNIIKQYMKHPQGFRYARKIEMEYSSFFYVRLKALIHLVSCNIFLKDYRFFGYKNWFLTFIALPFGFLLNFYIRFVNSKSDNK